MSRQASSLVTPTVLVVRHGETVPWPQQRWMHRSPPRHALWGLEPTAACSGYYGYSTEWQRPPTSTTVPGKQDQQWPNWRFCGFAWVWYVLIIFDWWFWLNMLLFYYSFYMWHHILDQLDILGVLTGWNGKNCCENQKVCWCRGDTKLQFQVFFGFHFCWQVDWVVVSTIFIFSPNWGRFPFWQIFFKWVGTINQLRSVDPPCSFLKNPWGPHDLDCPKEAAGTKEYPYSLQYLTTCFRHSWDHRQCVG